MAPDDLKFESLKEDRGWYFVEYSPPMAGFPFSILQISILESRDKEQVASAMEVEALEWLHRYPIAVMATAFSPNEDVFCLEGVRAENSLIAWQDGPGLPVNLKWELVKNKELPTDAFDKERLKAVFSKVPHKTGREIQAAVEKKYASHKVGVRIIFIWAVLVPLGVAILEWWSDLLGLAVLVYAFFKAGVAALRFYGRLPKSAREIEREKEDAKMRHHHYHCLQNPDGFERLKIENFERMAIEKTMAQAELLKADSKR